MCMLRFSVAAVFALWPLFLGGCEPPKAAPVDTPKVIPAEAKKVQAAFLPGTYSMHTAVVRAIDHKAIALSEPGPYKQVIYPFHPVMANGGVQKNTREKYAYRVGDVRVGDHVEAGIWCRDGDPYSVVEIAILKRPGGKVPESPYPNPFDRKPTYAMQQNAKNDFEDKGTPYPPGLQPAGSPPPPPEKSRK